MTLRPLLTVALASTLVGGAVAKGFTIDENGARPRDFRITMLARGLDSSFSPDIYQKSLFDRAGKEIKSSPAIWHLGLVDGKPVLVGKMGWGEDAPEKVIGDASDLDNLRLYPGVKIEGHKVWDMASRVWRTSANEDQWADLETYQGPTLDETWARDQLLAGLANPSGVSKENLGVLRSVLLQSWWETMRDENGGSGAQSPDFYIQRCLDFYAKPMRQAFASASEKGRELLRKLHEDMGDAAKERQDYYRKDGWRPEVFMVAFDKIRAELAAMAQEFGEK